MITMKGKYNSANIMIDELEQTAKEQIQSFLNHPAFQKTYISIMPDCHAGVGAVIGFTSTMNDYIIPNIVGVDIGCGVLSGRLDKKDIDFELLDNHIRNNIPHGKNVNSKDIGQDDFLDPFIVILRSKIIDISDRIGSNTDRNLKALGSLGGGNHFIEIGKDEDGYLWLTIHSGSRKFGFDIANFYQNEAKKLANLMFINNNDYKRLEYLPLEYGGNDYLKDMNAAQDFAEENRKIIFDNILNFLNCKSDKFVESAHNFIEDGIIRKGAISAYENQELIIPFNMEDGLIIGVGKSNKKWNYSAPHGAGRILSRRQAKEKLNLDEAIKSMNEKGIFTKSLNKDTLDEVKGAYKDKDLILNAISETVKVKHFVRPIYNFKSNN